MSDKRTSSSRGQRTILGRVSTTDAIVDELLAEILDGTLEAGVQLREIELSERFGVSRQSLRAALAELAFRGLVEREPYRSVRVSVITRADAADNYYMRELLEGEAVRWLASHPDAWPGVRAALDRLRHLPPDAPWRDIVEGDVSFHATTVNSLASPRLSRLHAHLSEEMRLILVPARQYLTQEEFVEEHQGLFDVITRGDPQAAVERLRQHLAFGTEDLLAHLPDARPGRLGVVRRDVGHAITRRASR